MSIEQYLTYQHNVQRIFYEHEDKYQGIIVPLSIAMSFPTGTYGFVRGMCTRDKTKRYALDPRTPLFQKAWDRARFVRPPHTKMAAALGGPFLQYGLARPLSPGDFADPATLDASVRDCLAVQKEFRTREEETKKLRKYQLMLGLKTLDPLREPQFLIPPYFQFDAQGDDWYLVSVACMRRAAAHADGIPVRPVLHFRSWESVPDWGALVAELRSAGIGEVFLYPNDLREHDATADGLRAYRDAVATMHAAGVTPYALHGGFFAMVLSKFGLAGFGNGVGYGEWRDSGYHRGGSASVRIYVPKLHRFVAADVAQALVDANPAFFASDSDLLAEYEAAGRPLADVSVAESWDHALACRKLEMDSVEAATVRDLRKEFRGTFRALKAIPPDFGVRFGRSLLRWGRSLC